MSASASSTTPAESHKTTQSKAATSPRAAVVSIELMTVVPRERPVLKPTKKVILQRKDIKGYCDPMFVPHQGILERPILEPQPFNRRDLPKASASGDRYISTQPERATSEPARGACPYVPWRLAKPPTQENEQRMQPSTLAQSRRWSMQGLKPRMKRRQGHANITRTKTKD